MPKKAKETPLMKQYNAIKAKYPGTLLLFRVGDFYETFGEDAIKAAETLEIVLTKRSNGAAASVELAGFPHHALDNYLPRLVRAGNRVAICDQLEDPKSVKGIVKRGVTELVTPGVSYNDNVLEGKSNNFLAAIHADSETGFGIALLDISTGEFSVAQGAPEYIQKLINSLLPREIIFCRQARHILSELLPIQVSTNTLEEWVFSEEYARDKLLQKFGTKNLKGFGIEKLPWGIIAAGAILHYLEETEHRETGHISAIHRLQQDAFVWMDQFTIRNLELIHPQQEGGTSLIQVIDKTVTAMGSRLLKKWVVFPLMQPGEIRRRHDSVEALKSILLDDLRGALGQIADLERLIAKVATARINPREFLQLRNSLEQIPGIQEILKNTNDRECAAIAEKLDSCETLVNRISTELKDEVPLLINHGNILRDGINEELDELRKIAFSGKDYLVQIQQREAERTGITSLKIAYNKVFGYYLEVSNAHKNKVPSEWIRKQTLVNAERYITEELKVYEEKIIHAEEKLVVIEQQLFSELVIYANRYCERIQQTAREIARLDCLQSFAKLALSNGYIRPEINDGLALDIQQGRHPVIEQQMPAGEKYIPNDVHIDSNDGQIMVITGPNMAGKSALLRQTALIVLLAQMGSFVPAKAATLGITDKVFTRVGASDNLSKGESTFMVEMTETASILNNMSSRSLILMDEIGRGTSTYDGVSIAWSILEFLHNHHDHRPKTLFATHYHELNQLADDFPRIRNFNVSVKQAGDKILFMRTLKPGGSQHSFGIHVAQLAGMPNKVVIRANEIMHFLEKDHRKDLLDRKMKEIPRENYQMSLFAPDPRYAKVEELLSFLDINTISPVEALLKLNEIQTILKNKD